MKKLFLIMVACLLTTQAGATGIYNNSGTAAADSITIPFFALDSAGNMVDIASGDSIFFQVHYPEGAMAFEDSGSYDGTGLDGSLVSNDFSTQTMYYYSDALADIDGTPVQGVYTYAIMVKDLTSAAITTVKTGTFQLVTETDFHTSLEYIKDVLDSMQAQDGWVAKEASLFDPASDSVIVDVSSAAADNGLCEVIADSVWDEVLTGATHNIATSAGRRLRQIDAAFTLATGTAQVSGTPTDAGKYIILASATSEADNFFNHSVITIDGGTGIGQARAIHDYTGATDSAALHDGDDWIVDPDATSTYVISAGAPVEVAHVHGEAIEDISHGIWGHGDTAWANATMGDQLTDLTDGVDVISISGDAGAADSLERMLDGTGATLQLSQLNVVSDGNKDAFVITGSGTGEAVKVTAGAEGIGVELTGGATTGEGLKIASGAGTASNAATFTAATTGAGIYTQGTPGFHTKGVASASDAMRLEPGATGDYINLGGTDDLVDSIMAILDTLQLYDPRLDSLLAALTNAAILAKPVSLSAAAVNTIWNEISLGGVVEDSTGNTTTRVQTNLAEATDNHYNGMMVYFIDGAEAVTARRITDYDGTNGWIVYDPATTAAPSSGDSIRILPWATVSATATVSDVAMGGIADSVWNRDTSDQNTAATYGVLLKDTSVYQGGAAGLSADEISDSVWAHKDTAWASATMGDQLTDLTDGVNTIQISGDAGAADSLERMLDGTGATLKLSQLVIVADGNKSALDVRGSGVGSGIYAKGGATGYGLHTVGQDANAGFFAQGGATNGPGAYFRGGAPNGVGFKLAYYPTGTGSDMDLAGTGTITGSITRADSVGAGGVDAIWNEDTTGHGTAKSFAVMLKDTSAYQGATSLTGAGPYTATIYATDTSGTDAYVSGVIISIIDMAGTNKGYISTATGGASVFNLESGDYAIIAPLGQGYVWLRDTITVSGANLTDTLWGYDVPVGSPGAPNLCRLYDYVYDLYGNAIEGVVVTAKISEKNVRDSCTNTAIPNTFIAKISTNPSGYWYLDLIETHCLEATYGSADTIWYEIKAVYPRRTEIFKKTYVVPDSTSHRMQW